MATPLWTVDAIDGPHTGQPVWAQGSPLAEATGAVVMLHGRGASAESILSLVPHLDRPGLAYLAPQAAGNSWYPNRFVAPFAANQPHLSSALALIGRVLERLDGAGIPAQKVALLGFSQGACLALDFPVRHPRQYGGVVAFSGGLIGPPGTRWNDSGSLAGTPVFLGCSDTDFHIPKERVLESADALRSLGADVTAKLYPGMGHTINQDEIEQAQGVLDRISQADSHTENHNE